MIDDDEKKNYKQLKATDQMTSYGLLVNQL